MTTTTPQRLVERLIGMVGLIVVFVSLTADWLGIGSGYPGIVRIQVIGAIFGAIVVAARAPIANLVRTTGRKIGAVPDSIRRQGSSCRNCIKGAGNLADVGMVRGPPNRVSGRRSRVRRAAVGAMAVAILVAACSGDTKDLPPDTGRSLPLPDVIDPRPQFTPELEHDGRWDIFPVPDNGRVVGIVDAGDGPVAVIANLSWDATRPKGERRQPTALRLYELEGNRWDRIADWNVPSGDTRVRWRFVSVLDGSIVVTGNTPEDDAAVSVVFDPPSDPQMLAASPVDGPEQLVDTISGVDSILGISSIGIFKEGIRAAVWFSPDGLRWDDATPGGGWPEDTVRLRDLAYGDGIWAIGARRGQGRVKTDFVMTSRDAIDWQPSAFDTTGGTDGIKELERLGSDGSAVLALGSDQAGDLVTQTLTDGTTWSRPQPVGAEVFGYGLPRFHGVVSYPDGKFLAGWAGFTDYRECFVADRPCGAGFDMVWMAQDATWLPIVAPSILDVSAVALIDGTLYVGGNGAIATWIPEQPGTIPVAVMPVDEPPPFDRPIVSSCGTVAGGVVYAWEGCEDCASFNDFNWEIETVTEDAAAILAESGAVAPEGRWGALPSGPVIYGTIELISSDRIEWSIPGYGPIAYLRRGDPMGVGCTL